MSNESGRCLEQLNAETGTGWARVALVSAVTIGIAINGSQPYGPVHLIAIIGGISSILFQVALLIPGSTCLQICEHGLVVRMLFGGPRINWGDIRNVSVQTTPRGDRVTLHLNPESGYGRTMPLYFTYRLPANTLAEKLSSFLSSTSTTHAPIANEAESLHAI